MKINPLILERGKPYKTLYKRIINAIKRYDKIAIFRHTTPDFDALGSQLGFYHWIKDNFPSKEVIYVGDNHVSYEGTVFPTMMKVNASWFDEPFLAIFVDVANTPRISDPRHKKAKYKIRIDHHPQVENWGKIILIDESFIACAEILANMFINFENKYTLSKETARNLYLGIVGDSGGFKYQNTTPHTFAIASELVNKGLDVTEINQTMFHKKMNELDLKKYALNNYKLSSHGVAYYIVSDKLQNELDIETEQGKECLALFQNVEGINCWMSVTEDVTDSKYRWRVSIRSNTTPINEVASHFNGGGHPNASGAKLRKIEELDALVKELDELFI